MAWWRNSERFRSVSIAVVVTGTHIALAVVLLSQIIHPKSSNPPDVLEIELADLAPEVSLPLPAPTPVREVSPEAPPPTETTAETSPEPVQTTTPQSPTVLTQLDTAPAGPPPAPIAATPANTSSGETEGDTVSPAQVASVLKQMHCLKLKRHEEHACPPPDPFQVAINSAERAIPPERLFGDPRYVHKSVSDKLFEREAAARFNWPDADLFNDPMAPGANNARRIRNGQEPLWSKEMRDGSRKADD